jgi:hypothetical protein
MLEDKGMSDLTKKVAAYATAISFVISVAVFISAHVFAGLSIEIGIAIGVASYIVITAISLVDVKYQWHRAIFGPIRKHLQYLLATIVVKEWNVRIKIDPERSANITHEIYGKVNFGYNKWITFGFMADSEQPDRLNFPISAKCTKTDNPLLVDFVIDSPKYKRVRINFENELERGEEFRIKVDYTLANTFFFDRDDYYTHHAFHNEEIINIEISFPDVVRIGNVKGEVTTEYGEIKGKHDKPLKKTDHFITWKILKGMHGDAFKVSWTPTLNQLQVQPKTKS